MNGRENKAPTKAILKFRDKPGYSGNANWRKVNSARTRYKLSLNAPWNWVTIKLQKPNVVPRDSGTLLETSDITVASAGFIIGIGGARRCRVNHAARSGAN
jgi:hypothetical protein